MQILFSTLFKDSQNFIRNQFTIIALILFLTAIITETVTLLFLPNIDSLVPVQQMFEKAIASYGNYSMQSIQLILSHMPTDEQKILVNLVFGYAAKYVFITLINSLITTSISLALIWQLAASGQFNFKTLFTKATSLMPSIFLFMLLSIPYFIALIILSSLISPVMIFILILGGLFYFMIYTLFLAYIIDSQSAFIFHNIKMTIMLLKTRLRLVLPIISLWLGTMLVLNFIASLIAINHTLVLNIIASFVNLLIYFFLFTYFYRLCSLSK